MNMKTKAMNFRSTWIMFFEVALGMIDVDLLGKNNM